MYHFTCVRACFSFFWFVFHLAARARGVAGIPGRDGRGAPFDADAGRGEVELGRPIRRQVHLTVVREKEIRGLFALTCV